MAYSVQADITNAVGEAVLVRLTNDAAGSTVDTTVLAAIIADVDDLIDGYLRNRYVLPLTGSTPGMINKIAVQLVVHALYTRRPNVAGFPEMVLDGKKDAMMQLREIQKGTLNPNIDQPSDDRIFVTDKKTTDREFTSTELEKY